MNEFRFSVHAWIHVSVKTFQEMMAIMAKRRLEAEAKDNAKWMDGKGR